ncbi:MAG: TIGR01777 family protein [Desulfobacterales bacterium]|nr:TIGR01777 family protein [Desulfobacterales bacterium]
MKNQYFNKKTKINASADFVFNWHSRQGCLERLIPPWDNIKVMHREGGINIGAKAILKIQKWGVPVTWNAKHTEYIQNKLFQDIQLSGPFSKWIHTHKFIPEAYNSCLLEDSIEYSLPFYPIGKILLGNFIKKDLEKTFEYRHRITNLDTAYHFSKGDLKPMNIMISGASGLIGTTLIPFLTTSGNNVIKLVRKQPSSQNEALWNPSAGELDTKSLPQIDAVIHLAGENIGEGRWTEEKKKIIIDSRVKGTELIAKTIANMNPLPKVLVCASAIGYYGDRGNDLLTENDSSGNNFVSKVCAEWEKAAILAIEKGIRVVFLRIGIVLSPKGGALKKLLLPFKLGVGGKISSGNQYMSWIGIDDVIRIIHTALTNDSLNGPINVVAPNPVTNYEFTKTLGKVLRRPTLFPIPAFAIKTIFGQMGEELLLSSTKVAPAKLNEIEHPFIHVHLEDALRHLLGM